MMKKTILTSILPALALSFTGCHNSDDPEAVNQPALVLVGAVYDIDAESSSIWHSGQAFGVYMLDNDHAPIVANVKHLADNRGTTGYLVPEGSSLYLPADGRAVNITAYYPFDGMAVENGHITTITVREGMAADACVWADARNASGANPKVSLGFKSQLSQIQGRLLNEDPATARIVVRVNGAPRSCGFDVINGRYVGTPDCTSPIGATVKVTEGAFEFTAIVAATESAANGPSIEITALDSNGKEIRTYPAVPLGDMLGLSGGRQFEQNTIYNLAGNLSAENVDMKFTGSSPICILNWGTDPDEETGTIIKNQKN